jgi:hypothetical protein
MTFLCMVQNHEAFEQNNALSCLHFMKFMLVISALITIVILISAFTMRKQENVEEQAFQMVHRDGELEIRFYPPATLATVQMKGTQYRDVANSGFRKLAGYIFGGNDRGQKIAMTAPVHMSMGPDGSSMQFVMPAGMDSTNLPAPNDANVKIELSKPSHVAAIRFSGYANDEAIRKQSEKLEMLLRSKGITQLGPVKYLGYDPPYRLVGRRNEVAAEIQWPTTP